MPLGVAGAPRAVVRVTESLSDLTESSADAAWRIAMPVSWPSYPRATAPWLRRRAQSPSDRRRRRPPARASRARRDARPNAPLRRQLEVDEQRPLGGRP